MEDLSESNLIELKFAKRSAGYNQGYHQLSPLRQSGIFESNNFHIDCTDQWVFSFNLLNLLVHVSPLKFGDGPFSPIEFSDGCLHERQLVTLSLPLHSEEGDHDV